MRPLDGITVVSLEQAVAAPFCTRQLADLGARVIKIERPGTGDFARGYDTRVRGLASHFVWTNRSKESVTLDVKHPQAREILMKLIARADVLVQNLAPGAAARLGLGDPAGLRERHAQGRRLADVEALGVVDVVLLEHADCLFVGDRLGDGLDPEGLGDADDRLDHVLIDL